MLDRLRDLTRDRDEQVDLRAREAARAQGSDVEGTGKLVAREDRHRKDRLVLVLGQIRKELEARVEMRLRRQHHGLPLGGGGAGDALAGPHPRPPRHLLDRRPVRRAQDELVRPLVVEVDKARVRLERVRDLVRDEREHLLEVERRVDGRDRLRQQAEVACGFLHAANCRSDREVGSAA